MDATTRLPCPHERQILSTYVRMFIKYYISYGDLKFNLIMANIAYFLDTLGHVPEQLCN